MRRRNKIKNSFSCWTVALCCQNSNSGTSLHHGDASSTNAQIFRWTDVAEMLQQSHLLSISSFLLTQHSRDVKQHCFCAPYICSLGGGSGFIFCLAPWRNHEAGLYWDGCIVSMSPVSSARLPSCTVMPSLAALLASSSELTVSCQHGKHDQVFREQMSFYF